MSSTTSTSPKEVALAFVDRLNAHDVDGLLDLMTDDHALVFPGDAVERGRDTMLRSWRGYLSAFPEYRITVREAVELGEVVVLIGETFGSHVAPHIAVHETVIWTARVRDGLVAEWRILYTDADKVAHLLEGGYDW